MADGNECIFVVEMVHFSGRESHSYVVGVFSSRNLASKVGEAHKIWSSDKYEYKITPVVLDNVDPAIMTYSSNV